MFILGVPRAPRVASSPVQRCQLRAHNEDGELGLVAHRYASPHVDRPLLRVCECCTVMHSQKKKSTRFKRQSRCLALSHIPVTSTVVRTTGVHKDGTLASHATPTLPNVTRRKHCLVIE